MAGERIASTQPDVMHFVRADVTSAEDWTVVVETCVSRFGRVDVLVNNAGTSYVNKVGRIEFWLVVGRLVGCLGVVCVVCVF